MWWKGVVRSSWHSSSIVIIALGRNNFRSGDSDRSLIRRNREQFTARPSFIAAGAESQLRFVSRNRGNRVSRASGKIFVFVFVFIFGGGGGGARAPFC